MYPYYTIGLALLSHLFFSRDFLREFWEAKDQDLGSPYQPPQTFVFNSAVALKN